MKKKIFWRIFCLLFLSVALVFSAGLWAVHRNSQQIIRERLTVEAQLLSCMITTEADINQLKAYENRNDFRITVIREDGEVLYESSMSDMPENHADREEVKSALDGTSHTVERYSETFDCRMTYYAVRSSLDNGDVIVLRLAVRSSEISSYLYVSVPLLLLTLALSLIISGLLAGRLSKQLSRKVKEVSASLRSLRHGDYMPIRTDSGEAEFYAVSCEINELNEETLRHIRAKEEEKEKLSVVLDNISQGIIALDPDGNIAFANTSACLMFGEQRQETGKPLLYLVEDAALCRELRHREAGGSFEYTYGDKELAVTVKAISDEALSGSVSAIIILTDITKQKSIAKEKSDFFANASHELKTPITVMQGLTELMLAKDTLDSSSRKQVERIHKESLRMADLISDMLKLSRLERQGEASDTTEEALLTVDLAQVTREILSELTERMQERGVTAEVMGTGRIQAEPKKIYELVENLCSNALNYNKEKGAIRISITQADGHVTFSVADTGIGIAKEHLPRLCERFYRVDKSRSKKTGGTGLGLAIVKHICALYAAELTIESEVDVGTTVTVIFKSAE